MFKKQPGVVELALDPLGGSGGAEESGGPRFLRGAAAPVCSSRSDANQPNPAGIIRDDKQSERFAVM
jgi:hypothetical protein